MKVNCNGSEKILGLLPVKLYSKRAIYGFIFEFDHLKLGYCVTTESRVYKFAEETLRKLKQFSRKTSKRKKKTRSFTFTVVPAFGLFAGGLQVI